MDMSEIREERASTWEEAADQVLAILAEKTDHKAFVGYETWSGHPMTTLDVRSLEIVRAWLLEGVDELRNPPRA